MRKLTVFAPKDQADALVRKLMRLRCVQVRQVDDAGAQLERVACDAQRAAVERRLAAVTDALEILAKFSSRKGFVQTRNQLDIEKFMAERYDAATQAVQQTLQNKQREHECNAEIAALEGRMHTLVPWLTYLMPLEMSATRSCEILLGSLPAKTKMDVVRDALAEFCAEVESVYSDRDGEYVSVICHKQDSSGVQRVLAEHGFIKASLKEFTASPKEEYEACKTRIEKLQSELVLIKQTMFAIAVQQDDIEALWDVENSALTAAIAKQKLALTGYCVVLEGWAPLARVDKVAEVLQDWECAFEFEEPAEGEEPPVLLRNNKFAQNFEWVVGMYSYPKYGTYDPTMIMSIFYFLIFGLMFADVGYGALLALGGFLAPPLLKMRDGMRRTLNMFGYCGIACIICGVIFGGWFGDMPYAIMVNLLGLFPTTEAAVAAVPFFNGVQLTLGGAPTVSLNPMYSPMAFLVVSLGVGALHLIAGFVVKFVLLCKDKHVFAAIFDVGSWLIIFAGAGAFFLHKTVGIAMVVLGVLMIVFTAGRGNKNPILWFFKGLLGLYDAINYAADLLSYSRILALGLASAVIAQVVNMVGTMFVSGVPGFVVLLLVSLIGHSVNMALNVLGSFVHTSRLQYLEFFGKFFEDGG
ncbi:MAG: V-type ATP synthase subunit I, partial [Clostridia bacterium]|nr:V-type ATP synthase subunit I [Clostridia bacterium]